MPNIDDLTPREVGRIIERLDQQDRNFVARDRETKEVALRLSVEAREVAHHLSMEARDIAHRLAGEAKENASLLAAQLAVHIKDDEAQQHDMNTKLDKLIDYQTQQRGGIRLLMALGAIAAAIVGWFATVWVGR